MRDTVRLWILPAVLDPDELDRCRAVLDPAERARATALGHPSSRHRFTVAHGALRLLVGALVDAPPEDLAWTEGRYGKPTTTGPAAGLHTSLSYSGDLVAIAVSVGRTVGVDLQHPTPGRDPADLAARFFHPSEVRHVAAGGDLSTRQARFTRLWTRKEAVVKAAGVRLRPYLALPVHRGDVVAVGPAGPHRLTDVATSGAFRVAVALVGTAPYTVRCGTGRRLTDAVAVVASTSSRDHEGRPAVPGRSAHRHRTARRAGDGGAATGDEDSSIDRGP
ncbi:4'-phosphopantetheinyl transferase family protein [Micromonospora siamensis]|uniref:4'-phosphopantetheinyl transferase n=1 Tax=Micromonospora siamensis TaxID=299152 RepID=A0A1C5J5N3_9ACTN|nr:4'-phosphopantetheinyl transferase superfamily protein [Micromonospora siamensis]SCG65867.1 4'-phosphopantetheinyl transferase [Micromonospora siamensis]